MHPRAAKAGLGLLVFGCSLAAIGVIRWMGLYCRLHAEPRLLGQLASKSVQPVGRQPLRSASTATWTGPLMSRFPASMSRTRAAAFSGVPASRSARAMVASFQPRIWRAAFSWAGMVIVVRPEFDIAPTRSGTMASSKVKAMPPRRASLRLWQGEQPLQHTPSSNGGTINL